MYKLIILLLTLISITACKEEMTLQERLGYKKEDIVVIVNADDYGGSRTHTDATNELFEKTTYVKTATIMATNPDFERAAKIAVQKGYQIGIHITLTNEWQDKYPWTPVLSKEEVPSLYNKKGLLWATQKEIVENATLQDIEKEMEAQILKVIKSGIKITHMDAHMYIYYPWFSKQIEDIADKLSKKYRIHRSVYFNSHPDDNKRYREMGRMTADQYFAFYGKPPKYEWGNYKERLNKYVQLLDRLKPGVYHITIHPVLDNEEAKRVYPQWKARYADYKIWFSKEIKDIVKKRKIKFTDYSKFNQLEKEFRENKKNR